MDVQALKPVSSVAAAPGVKGKPAVSAANTGKDLPPPPPPESARIDPAVMQSQQERRAAVAQQMNAYLRSTSRNLDFQVDFQSGEAVITVRDAAGNVVRTIPGEEAMQMLRRASVESGTFVDSMV
jgi:uncharacterized FlaG/YvyC family protein